MASVFEYSIYSLVKKLKFLCQIINKKIINFLNNLILIFQYIKKIKVHFV